MMTYFADVSDVVIFVRATALLYNSQTSVKQNKTERNTATTKW